MAERQTTVIAGVDFGTYSTKVLVRKRNEDSFNILRIGKMRPDELDSYVWFVTPSRIFLDSNDRLMFGRSATRASVTDGTLFDSPKLRLLGAVKDSIELPASPDLLAAVFLSRKLRLVRKAVDRYFGTQTRILINAAAPVTRLGGEPICDRYLRIVNAAWLSVFGPEPFRVEQGTSLSDCGPVFEQLLSKDVAPPSERLFDVLPETIAPLVSLLEDPRMTSEHLYLVVNVGGATTEISANYVHSKAQVDCFIDETLPLGSVVAAQASGTALASDIAKAVKKTCGTAYTERNKSKSSRDKFRELTIVLSGGGAKKHGVESAISNIFPIAPLPIGEDEHRVEWSAPVQRARGEELGDGLAPILTVAHGLAMERRTWPDFSPPDRVPRETPDEMVERGVMYHEDNS